MCKSNAYLMEKVLHTWQQRFNHLVVPSLEARDRHVTYEPINEALSCIHCCPWKSNKYYFFWVCVGILALAIWLAKSMLRIILLSDACPSVPQLSTLSHKWHDTFFWKKKMSGHKVCVLISATIIVWYIFHSNNNSGKSDVWLTVHRNSVWIRKTN